REPRAQLLLVAVVRSTIEAGCGTAPGAGSPAAARVAVGTVQLRHLHQLQRVGWGRRRARDVDAELAAGEAVQSGVFAAADAVFDPGLGAVAGVEEGRLSGRVSVSRYWWQKPSRSSNSVSRAAGVAGGPG